MKNFKTSDRDLFAALAAVVAIVVVLTSVVLAITNKLRQHRLLCRLSQCVDSIQRAMPSIEQASRIYINANDSMQNEDLSF